MESVKEKNKLYFITFLQVIGPIFVILGHAKNGLPYNIFLQGMRTFIYVFHMPLFFFISSYLFSYKNGMRDISYNEWIKKKFWRLIFPYVVINLIFILPKVLLSGFTQDKLDFSLDTFITLCINPRENILGHLWFLFALFEMYLISPLWNYMIKNKENKKIWIIAFIICVCLRMLPQITNILSINDLFNNLLFFLMGLYIGTIPVKELEKKSDKKNLCIYLIIYILSLVVWLIWKNELTTTILCIITLLLLLKLPIALKIKNNTLNDLGKYSYTIYILHWPAMLSIRILLFQIMHVDYRITSAAMVVGGAFAPIFIAKIYEKVKQKKNFESKIIYYLLGI